MSSSGAPRASLLLLAIASACVRQDKGGTQTRTTTGDTGTLTTFDGFAPFAFGIDAATFAVDDQGRAAPYTTTSGIVPVTITVLLVDATVNDGLTAQNSCHVTFRGAQPLAPATWAAGTAAYAGWSLDDQMAVSDDCGDKTFPPGWEAGPAAVLAQWEIGFGLGTLDPAVEGLLPEFFGTGWEELAPYVAGGGYYWEGLVAIDDLPLEDWLDGWVDTSVVYGYALEPDLSLKLVGGQPVTLEADTLFPGGQPVVARYDLQSTTLLTPARLLLDAP
ncbi:MAG: hypothetical protein KC621_05040 [Myxococcales bacterium]|nr:hypothetical protein [Myxococcales bacterium]